MPDSRLIVLLTRKLFGEASPEELLQWDKLVAADAGLQSHYDLLASCFGTIPGAAGQFNDAVANAHFDYIMQSASGTDPSIYEELNSVTCNENTFLPAVSDAYLLISVTLFPEKNSNGSPKNITPEKITFQGNNFHELAIEMEKWFNSKIILKNNKPVYTHFHGTVEMRI